MVADFPLDSFFELGFEALYIAKFQVLGLFLIIGSFIVIIFLIIIITTITSIDIITVRARRVTALGLLLVFFHWFLALSMFPFFFYFHGLCPFISLVSKNWSLNLFRIRHCWCWNLGATKVEALSWWCFICSSAFLFFFSSFAICRLLDLAASSFSALQHSSSLWASACNLSIILLNHLIESVRVYEVIYAHRCAWSTLAATSSRGCLDGREGRRLWKGRDGPSHSLL